MPKKIRELKAMLRKAGFFQRSGKGSHTVWEHPKLQDKLTLSGRDGDDAQRYQEMDVREFLRKCKRGARVTHKYEHYSMVIQWSEEDKVYIVTVSELPGCRTHGKTYKKAIRQGQDAIESWIDASLAGKHIVPAPKVLVSQ